jgi:hypothetical protein
VVAREGGGRTTEGGGGGIEGWIIILVIIDVDVYVKFLIPKLIATVTVVELKVAESRTAVGGTRQ